MEIGQFLLTLIALFAAAKLFGEIAERFGQPAVLGELVGGIVVGVSGLHLVDPHDTTIHLLSELGVILLLFLIGLETDLHRLISVGLSASSVAVVGVALPFLFGYLVGLFLGYTPMVSIFLGATLTATSVGITARVLSDLGHLQDSESQVVLGAAVVDDVIGLIILTVVSSLAAGEALTFWGVSKVTLVAFGFIGIAILLGNVLAPYLVRAIAKLRVTKALLFGAMMFAFTLAYLADVIGSAMIVGAFAAGLVLARTERGHEIAKEVSDIAQFFVPFFFVSVGAAVDLSSMNPFNADTRKFFWIGLALTIVAIVGKIAAGWAVIDRSLRKIVVGVGMIPRGEVGLIFARIGLTSGILVSGVYSSVALMIMVTTFITPPILKWLLGRRTAVAADVVGLTSVVTEAPFDDGEH